MISTNAMVLLGFGYIMTVVKTNQLSVLVFTLFINALIIQWYLLIQGFWVQVFSGFRKDLHIPLSEKLLIKACYCVVSNLISLMAVFGRINPTEILKVSLIHTVGYALNEQIV